MERRRLGRTGHESSVAVLGGAACWAATVEEAGEWLAAGPRPRGEPPRHRAAVRGGRVGGGPAPGGAPRGAVHRGEDAAGQPRRRHRPVRHDPPPAQRRGARPLPGPRRDLPRGARPALGRAGADPGAARRRPHPLRRHHRARHGGAAGPPRGAPPFRPRHRDVPGLSRAVVPARVPRAGRGAPRPVRRARRRRHGDQGGGAAALGRRPPAGRRRRRERRHRGPLGRLVVRAAGQ